LPWAIQRKVATATQDQWEYFFGLRRSADADPAMQEVANNLWQAIVTSRPVLREPGEWHLPYITDAEREGHMPTEGLALVSAARCARVSYANHDGTPTDLQRDLALANRLMASRHWTPFEHQGTPMRNVRDIWSDKGQTHIDRRGRLWSANFCGWVQHRKLIDEAAA
jgi:thymidylate synthase ThyX